MVFSLASRLAIAFSLLALTNVDAQAANRCVDAKGKTLPLSRCAVAPALPLATPGTYSTLPQRSPPTRGPQGKVYSSNPHPDTAAPIAGVQDGVAPPAMPVVIQLNAGGTATVPGTTAPTSTTRPVRGSVGSGNAP